jgi:hypothetical protein
VNVVLKEDRDAGFSELGRVHADIRQRLTCAFYEVHVLLEDARNRDEEPASHVAITVVIRDVERVCPVALLRPGQRRPRHGGDRQDGRHRQNQDVPAIISICTHHIPQSKEDSGLRKSLYPSRARVQAKKPRMWPSCNTS